MVKEIKFEDEARQSLKRGIDVLADAVQVTLGAKGRTVLIENDFGLLHPTKDGVTVAKHVTLENPLENLGAKMVTQVASKVADEAERAKAAVDAIAGTKMFEEDELKENFENEMADALATQAEEILRDAEARGEDLDIDKVLDMVMGDMRGLLK